MTESETELIRYTDIHDRYMCTVCVNKRVSDRERNITNAVQGYT